MFGLGKFFSRTSRPGRARARPGAARKGAPRRLELEVLEQRLVLSPISDKYAALGGAGGFLGQPTTAELIAPDRVGQYEHFQGGSIYWSPPTGAHEVHGYIRDEYAHLGWEGGLGYPTSDETATAQNGRYNSFQGGYILWSAASGAHEVNGAILSEYAALGLQNSALGFPTTDEATTGRGDGRFNFFQGGAILWSPSSGAHEVHGYIRDEYAHLGWEASVLGYPTSDETATGQNGRYNSFQGGYVLWSAASGAHEVSGAILSEYAALGWQYSALGYPTTDETGTPDGAGRFNHFQGGAIDWTPATGAHEVHGAIAAKFASLGWENAGEVVTDQINLDAFDLSNTSGAYNRFQSYTSSGWVRFAIDWTPENGASRVSGTCYTDIQQGSAGTCWINAAMAAAEHNGQDLSQLIQSRGNNWYSVALYNYNNPNNHATGGYHPDTKWVYFDGNRNAADPQWDRLHPSQSWAVIVQRAIIEAIAEWDPSQSVTAPHSGDVADPLGILTGRGTQGVGAQDGNALDRVSSALASGRNVALHTRDTTATLVGSHVYAVLNLNYVYHGGFLFMTSVTLYNPWGSEVTLPWSAVVADGSGFVTN